MPHDLVTTRQEVLAKSSIGGHDRVVLTKHEAPAGPNNEVEFDPFQEFDEWAARQVMKTLEQHYPDHCFRVIHDSHQGVCLISIPILMGVNKFMAVNLKTHSMDDKCAVAAGGEIQERYGLRRGRMQLAPFLEAREKHSALVVPSREVPG
jgi:hypothetical protein